MRKMIILVGALALIGAFSASSASAKTVLCSKAETTCAAGNVMPSGSVLGGFINTEVEPETAFSLKTSSAIIGTVSCKTGGIGAKSTAEMGNPLPGTSESSLANCTSSCLKPEISFKSPSPATMVATGSGNGTLTFGNSKEHQSVTISCPSVGLSGTYGAASVPFQLNASKQNLTATNVSLSWESGSKLGTGPVTLNTTLGVVGRETYLGNVPYTVLCSKAETTCAAGNVMPSGSILGGFINTEAEPETAFSLKTSSIIFGTVSCKTGGIGAKSTAEMGNPLPGTSESSLANCTSSCSKPEISFKSPSPATMVATGSGNGTLTFGNSKEHQSVTISCPLVGVSGTYGAAAVPFQLNASKQTLTATNVSLNWESGNKLGTGPVTLNATLGVVGRETYLGSL